MVVFTFLFASVFCLLLGGISRYLGFRRNWARYLHPESRWLVIVLIVLWVAAPFIEVLVIVWCVVTLDLDEDLPFTQEVLQYLGVALGLLQGCIAFAIGWLAGPEADIPYRPRNPFQEDMPPVFLFQPNRDGDNNWLDVPVEKDEAA